MPLAHHALVDEPDQLGPALAGLGDLDPVGVDVERADWDRYYRQAALIQVGGQGQVVLVDPLRLDDLGDLDRWLTDRTVVFHALENDLQPLEAVGVRCPRVADTAVAAAVLGLPTGLATLLEDLLGVTLADDKAAMQRADWEARPLTTQMCVYAAGDVADLPALWAALADRLDAEGRRDWYEQELRARIIQPSVEDRRGWRRTKGIGRLGSATLARVRALWATREDLARRTDTAPSRILGDKVLVDLATRPPAARGELGARGMRRAAVREFGDDLLDALADAPPIEAHPPGSGPRRRITDDERALVDRLRGLRTQRAAELGIDPGVLCPGRLLSEAVLADPCSRAELRAALDLRPWQWDQLAELFAEALELDTVGKPEAIADV